MFCTICARCGRCFSELCVLEERSACGIGTCEKNMDMFLSGTHRSRSGTTRICAERVSRADWAQRHVLRRTAPCASLCCAPFVVLSSWDCMRPLARHSVIFGCLSLRFEECSDSICIARIRHGGCVDSCSSAIGHRSLGR
jgi:hypothetical protein